MTPRQTGQHRRNRPAVAPVLGELRRERARVADTADQLAAMTAERDTYKTALEALWALVNDGTEGDGHAACRAARLRAESDAFAAGVDCGRELEAADTDEAWHAAADPLAHPGPAWAELESLRWGPGGRAHFADPRPSDYRGGVVMWDAPAGEAMAS